MTGIVIRRPSKLCGAVVAVVSLLTAMAVTTVITTSASAQVLNQPLGYAADQQDFSDGGMLAFPADRQALKDRSGDASILPQRLQRQIVSYGTREPSGTVVIDTSNTALYYVLGEGRAIRYGVGVGREGFTWSGTQTISRKAEWPDWHPPAEMISRQPYLPRFMAGGPGNPLGARAMYLGSSVYRIHGTNDPSTIGKFVSSGCIRLTNTDVEDLFNRVNIGTKVVVLSKAASAHSDAGHADYVGTRSINYSRSSQVQPVAQRQAVNLLPTMSYQQ